MPYIQLSNLEAVLFQETLRQMVRNERLEKQIFVVD